MAAASSPIGRAIVVSSPLPSTVVDADSDHNIETIDSAEQIHFL